ncbi:MAG TPA: hypothetical protein VMF03_16660 [Steroidobacteraceae bacterium]|nr:hypothetical protein [Steroidobacteraceae bacterium]
MSAPTAIVGVTEHGNSAVLVTVCLDGRLLDRRRIDLTPPGTPTHPHHHEGSWAVGRYLNTPGARRLSLADAVSLVERVAHAAGMGARDALDALATSVLVRITGIALRSCPSLPATIEKRIKDSRTQTCADTVMYRQALASAATARGWFVHWYERERIFEEAAAARGCDDIAPDLIAMGKAAGPPWTAHHKQAAAAAIAAGGSGRR